MKVKEKKGHSKMNFFEYFTMELTHGYFMDQNDTRYSERRQRVYTFLKQPREIEKMMGYGVLLCLDVFLYVFTFLPLRVIFAVLKIVLAPWYWLQRKPIVDPTQRYDLLKGALFAVCICLMSYIDTSYIYHTVRAQTLIKLYIIYNMLEVADRLFSSFGQDILDALFLTATESKRRKRDIYKVLLHLILAAIYVFAHAVLVLFEATTLNVAFNSHNKVLLTVMMANNFVEIKGTVFKKYDKNNLFQISCSDVRERFHYLVLMLIVLLRNMQQYSWNYEHFMDLLPNMIGVICSEFIVDWFKHAFVLKFNHIPIDSYKEYRATFAYDVVTSRNKGAISDHSDIVSRRLGFIPLPLAVLIFHVTRISIDFEGAAGYLVILMGYFILVLLKVLNSILIVGQACIYISDDVQHEAQARLSHSKLVVVDPFEQRGNKIILISEDQSVDRSYSSSNYCSSRQSEKKNVGSDLSVDGDHKGFTPARARSMRAPSVDHIVATENTLSNAKGDELAICALESDIPSHPKLLHCAKKKTKTFALSEKSIQEGSESNSVVFK
ncbi:transmembrane anterior posterior transformation protein 1 homolog [Clavelina lepadiformis]|uniref:Transmembrane anterior posterior transformation protein 1 n=1 Tax=Clavelina lepadiformis TaxID=159417 RepID=A0ABP0GD65_CLALP